MPTDIKGIVEAKKQEKLAIDEHFTKNSGQKAHDVSVVLESLFSKYGLNQKSNLNKEQIFALLRAIAYNEKFHSELGTKTIEAFLELSISDKARGRDDVVNIVNTVLATQAPHAGNGLVDRLFGGLLKR